jgi:hypothetical protein
MIISEEELNIKMKFYAQYFGQKIVRSEFVEKSRNLKTVNANCFAFPHLIINSCLELKSIENIDNEDAQYLVNLIPLASKDGYEMSFKEHEHSKEKIYKSMIDFRNTHSFILDFLRSKGYAVPFMEYSIDDLIKMNFIKITQ